ncbi:PAS domain-containing protein [Roseibium salinum]|nr:PAS domain-containing protein [Roseibium salinum]
MEAQRIASVGSWERDIATNEIWGSEEFHRIMDVPPLVCPRERSRKGSFSRIPAHQLDATQAMVGKAMATCGEFDLEHSLVLEDGDVRYMHVRGYVLPGPTGEPATVIGTVHDITDRCLAERRNNLLANILESSLNEIYILNTDTFRIEFANKCALTNLGYSLEELEAQRIWDINPVYDQETVRRHVAPPAQGCTGQSFDRKPAQTQGRFRISGRSQGADPQGPRPGPVSGDRE